MDTKRVLGESPPCPLETNAAEALIALIYQQQGVQSMEV